MLPQGEPDDAEVFDFLDEYTRDVEAQRAHPLAHYLRRYPGHEEAIAREFLARQEREHTSSAAPSVDAHGGERRIGPYRLLRELGRGGQGAVWLVEDTRIARKVALKFLPQSFALMSVDARRRLQREAEVVSRLEHPSICPVYEALIDGETPYIAMRFVEGETLASAIASVKKNRAASSHESTTLALGSRNGADIRRVLVFFERAARALHAAHEAGVIHRDIKPGNLMVSRDGEPVVLDFGQARDEHAALSEMTISGEVVGTPAYMSPEQVTGSARAVDRRTDVWSLGASLYEALTLERPFAGRTVTDLMLAIQTRPLRSARELNPAIGDELAVVLETALEKDVHRRYASALELAEDLRRIREYEPIRARPAGPILRTRRWIRRNPALTAVMVALTAGLSSSLYLLRKEQDALAGKAAALGATQDALQGKADALADTEEALNGKAAALADAEAKLIDALGRHLAGRANDLLDQDSSASLILGIQAVQYAPNYQTRAALLSALGECRLATLLEPTPLEPDPPQLFIALDVGRDSRVVAAGLEDGTAHVFSLADGKEIARTSVRACELGQIRLDRECAQIVTSASDGFVRVWNA
jgi:serine/threonine protein kinase